MGLSIIRLSRLRAARGFMSTAIARILCRPLQRRESIMAAVFKPDRVAASSSELKSKTAATPSNAPMRGKVTKELLQSLGHEVLPPRGEAFVIGSDGPIRSRTKA